MQEEIVVKTIKKEFKNTISAGVKWYSIICTLNDIKLTRRQLQLLAFINYRGTISSPSAKEDFCKLFGSSEATISNMISQLTSLKLLVKEKSKTKINPSLRVDFTKDFVVRLFIKTKEKEVFNVD